MKNILFILLAICTLIGCSKDEEKDTADRTYTFTAKSTYFHGMWSIPNYSFTYPEEYARMTVEATINGQKTPVLNSASTKGTLYYKLQRYGEGEHTISIYNVEHNGSVPITIKIYK